MSMGNWSHDEPAMYTIDESMCAHSDLVEVEVFQNY